MLNQFNSDNMRLKESANYLNISLATLWRLGESDPTFPPKIRLSSRCCIYRKSDLDAWLISKES
ncbi:AlpA family phage regulatory protein [Pseudoalteromonas sp. TB64]|uniref:helix-turn-helix transcriptional regulator n=1 Tax=Pseudoalteromonas sp. TB64 TaxID=1938600 RepID=UPI0009767294|nr:AlpA family phage regulatory protein [Pseudoalteromonas sp. TB64]